MLDKLLSLTSLHAKLGLHEDITIIYVVDGYQACLYGQDGGTRLEEAHGKTILAALINLNDKLKEQR